MAQLVDGVIARSERATVEVVRIQVPDPGPREVVVRIQACGVCETDQNYRDGRVGDGFPFLLGHEAAGVVEQVGDEVDEVAVGDFVILNWRAVCGICRACRRGKPWNCLSPLTADQPMTLTDGTPLTPVLGVGGFAEKTLVHARQCTKVDPAVPPTAAAPLGCGIATGIGAALNTGGVERGDSVAVFGCDGIGSAAIAGARLAGADPIVAIDDVPRNLEWASGFGATHTIDTSVADPVPRILELTGGLGADVVIDTTARLETWKQALRARGPAGTLVMLGLPAPDEQVDIPLHELRVRGGSIRSSWYGDTLPARDFPALIGFHRQGLLDLDAFVTETISLSEVEQALSKSRRREVLRSVIRL
ncbi:S-(hydroxymethyl)mycothiol dehydrogenase [Nocardia terpenica]|uniref:S-(hydroxymethyl)mycothiol dehydrogenase n=1 Tax=Nocardia terpenica TaxID=455432 RepID=UPI0018938A96|nr:S-(hydroxymethyl)mycothiol dehydrogenase [Nocardia terpenica]MBF6065284.1 S-(hydroxymethyl)mycothiol dehydrogenase [Nocardia terpenica]MBF6108011.1 S-(hydroxymethyl)mycothiol dehydrogenase [Nocardia terpenica]MBF6115458.1 S-(hydroxymethyl)mycothiol dehydrogenase [Nocardia terpenica]MBF6121895.1 S-(hydroxymethyl)mycothiol dehydrogenase [Nocardia terpenica]MBF6155561.1 S-(hydroxymethyl)mycothiol dehydrogenase [Nocardia terpenica]